MANVRSDRLMRQWKPFVGELEINSIYNAFPINRPLITVATLIRDPPWKVQMDEMDEPFFGRGLPY